MSEGQQAQLQVYLDRAMRMLKQGQLNEAEDACHAALEAVPDDARPIRVLAAIDQRRGDTRRAVGRLESILRKNMDDPAIWRQLGILYAARSDHEAAVKAFDRVLGKTPGDHAIRIRLADIERERGNAESALGHAETVLNSDPSNSDAQWLVRVLQAESPDQQAVRRENASLFSQALRAQYQGDRQRAETLYRALLKRDSANFPSLHMLGVLLAQTGRATEAVGLLKQACSLRKNDPDVWNNLAASQTLAGEYRHAVESLRKALKLRPSFAEAYNNLGRALTMLNRFDDAARSFRRAIRLRSDYFDAHANLGDLFLAQGANADAASTYADALKLAPGHPAVETQRGTAFFRMARLADAMKCYDQALARQPDFAPAHVNRSFVLLSQGDYHQGWSELEWRFRDQRFGDAPARRLPMAKRWRGGTIAGKHLLVYTEGTTSETLMLLRFLPVLRARNAKVTLWCSQPWAGVFRDADIADELHTGNRLPAADRYDHFVPLMSLPQLLGTDLETIPAQLDLSALSGSLPPLFEDISSAAGIKMGLVLDHPSQAAYRFDHCCPAEALRPLFGLSGLQLVMFDEVPKAFGSPSNLTPLHGRVSSVESMLAAIDALDCVIGVESTIVHLALALGKPTWVLLGTAPDWMWAVASQGSPWYPKARMLRVGRDGDWRQPFAQVAAELERAGRQ